MHRSGPDVLLDVHELAVNYGPVRAVRNISLHVAAGEIVAILGANGAGKSTTLRALIGLREAAKGSITFDGQDVTRWPPSLRVRSGLVLVPEGRQIIMGLTVHENLLMGAFNRSSTNEVPGEIEQLYQRFSQLAARRNNLGSVLSGGEQQMLAIARALLAAPTLIMFDEPSLGLSPRVLDEVFAYIDTLRRERNMAILVVEQNPRRVLDIADRVYVFELGEVVSEGSPDHFLADDSVLDACLGQQTDESRTGGTNG